MRPMLIQNNKSFPVVVGHRGAAGLAPENTLRAFEVALQLGVDGVEFDVQRSADGELMIFHDETLERTTNGQGYLKDFTRTELQNLDAGNKFGEVFRGEKIPTLYEVVDFLRHTNLILHLEVKSPHLYAGIAEQLVGFIRGEDMVGRIQVRSFDHQALHKIYQLAPEIAISELWWEKIPIAHDMAFPTLNALYTLYTPENIAALHQVGKKVTAWTVNDAESAKRLIVMGIDGLTTDYPDRILEIVQNFANSAE